MKGKPINTESTGHYDAMTGPIQCTQLSISSATKTSLCHFFSHRVERVNLTAKTNLINSMIRKVCDENEGQP
jgi:hypothetical protein